MSNPAPPITVTAEQLLLAAIFRTMKPRRKAEIVGMIGETTADNIVRLHAPHDPIERNQLIRKCRVIAGLDAD